MTVQFAPMRVEDCPEVAAFLARALPASWRRTGGPDEMQCMRVVSASTVIAIVARDHDMVIGLATGWVFPNLVGQGDTVMLDELLVGPSHRGQGVGTSLVRAFTSAARQKAKPPVELWATTDYPEEPAAAPFRKAGGTPGGLLRQFDWPQEASA